MRVDMNILRGYLSKMFLREGWRFRSWNEEDYIQEGLCLYLTIERRYPDAHEPKHMMSLFKTSLTRHMHDKSKNEHKDESVDSLLQLEAEAILCADEVRDNARHMSSDAQALLALFMSPMEVVGDITRGIVFTTRQARALAQKLNITPQAVRRAAVEIQEGLTMATPIQLLATATGCEQKEGEERAAYLTRLIAATAELDDEGWNKLPKAGQAWFNSAAEATNSNRPVEDIPDPAPKETKKKEPPAAVVANNGSGVVLTMSPTGRAREIMVLDSEIMPQAVSKQLTNEGYPTPALSALQAMRSDIRSVLRILSENGRLKDI